MATALRRLRRPRSSAAQVRSPRPPVDAIGGLGAPGAASALAAALALLGSVGCLLPWERLEVTVPTQHATRSLDGLHGIGIAACCGAAIALLAVAATLWRGRARAAELAGLSLGALLMLAGSLLALTGLGLPLDGGNGSYAIRLGPGLPITAVAGALLLACCVASRRRGGSPRPG